MNKMIEKFKNEDIAVHCNTQKEYDELMKLLEKYDFRWRSGGKPTCFNAFEVFKSKTYINVDLYNIIPGLGYADKYYYVIKKYELIECKDFIKQVNAEERTSLLEVCTIEIKQENTVNGNLINYVIINGQKCRLSLIQYEIIKKLNSILDYIKDDED